MDWIRYNRATTDLAPYVPVSGGSCTVYSVGRAVHKATIDLKGKVFQRASELLKVPIDELE